MSLKEKILKVLTEAKDYLPTLEIARQAIGKGAKTGQVNTYLYQLQAEGLAEKRAEPNGSKPHWRLKIVTTPASVVTSTPILTINEQPGSESKNKT